MKSWKTVIPETVLENEYGSDFEPQTKDDIPFGKQITNPEKK